VDLEALVQQNIHAALQDFDDTPEMGIRDSMGGAKRTALTTATAAAPRSIEGFTF
jgi:hypothetical protein